MKVWNCNKCGKEVREEDVFTISGLGGKYFLVPFCEPCVDTVLNRENEKFRAA